MSRRLIFLCFFLSGAAGLLYEVVWARQLGLFLGITLAAHTAVITAFMAGLAAGSFWFGPFADRCIRPVRMYAWLEVGIAVYAALTPWVFTLLQSAYAGWSGDWEVGSQSGQIARFVISLAVLFVPTFLMGGTLPLLARALAVEIRHTGPTTSRLYGFNTIGAICGVLAAGYLLLPLVGIRMSIFFGVATNLVIATLALLIDRHAKDSEPVDSGPQGEAQGQFPGTGFAWMILISMAAAGFSALLIQMAWIRAMILVVGGSVYAFAITLACFLSGIGFGSLISRRFAHFFTPDPGLDPLRKPVLFAAALTLLVSVTVLAGMPVISQLPAWFLAAYGGGLQQSFALFQLFVFTMGLCVMLLPTLLMGALFPVMAAIWTQVVGRTGQGVGTAYGSNTVGTILGALVGGMVILPRLGMENSLILGSAVYLGIALVLWFIAARQFKRLDQFGLPAAAVIGFILLVSSIPSWQKEMLVSGVFFRPGHLLNQTRDRDLESVTRDGELLYYREGMNGVVSVTADGAGRRLVINGKTDASNTADMQTQLLLGQIPALLHPNPAEALVVGLGSGITAGAVATHTTITSLDVLEISSEVIEASAFFSNENHDVLQDRRVRLITADARNFLLASDRTYDLIISEPSNPWISGVSNLFTSEFFELAKRHLAPDGIMTQWFHTYSMSTADLKTIVATYAVHFQYLVIWSSGVGDLIMTGSDRPVKIDLLRYLQLAKHPQVGQSLAAAGVNSARDLVGRFLMEEPDLSNWYAGARLNTDDKPRIEFNAPRNLYGETLLENLLSLGRQFEGKATLAPVSNMAGFDGAFLHVPALEMGVSMADPPQDPQVNWLLRRSIHQEQDGAWFETVSDRQIAWREGSTANSIQAIWLKQPPAPVGPDVLMKTLLKSPGLANGEIELAGVRPATWLLGRGPGPNTAELVLVWTCPAGGESVNYFVARSNQVLSSEGEWRPALEDLAARIFCFD